MNDVFELINKEISMFLVDRKSTYEKDSAVDSVANHFKESSNTNPSPNIDHILSTIITLVGSRLGINERNMNPVDRQAVYDFIIKLKYYRLMISEYLEKNNFQVSETTDPSPFVAKLESFFSAKIVNTNIDLSVSNILKMDAMVQGAIDEFYFSQTKRPFWKFWL